MWQQQQKRPQTGSSGPRRPAPLVCLGSRWMRAGPRSLSLIRHLNYAFGHAASGHPVPRCRGSLSGRGGRLFRGQLVGDLRPLLRRRGWIRRSCRRLESQAPRGSRIDGGAGWWAGRVAEKGPEFWVVLCPGMMSGERLLDTSQADCLLARFPER
ncbi:hypothetical protein BKA80DRAFT_261895 [Phyllosticta citrichinensis]